MSQEPGIPTVSQPVESLSWSEVWISALTRPSVATFERLVSDPNATSKRAYVWVFVSALIGVFVSTLSGLGPAFGGASPIGPGPALVTALLCVPIDALLSVLGLMIGTAITQGLAGTFGGTGTYAKLVYAVAAFTAPLTLVAIVLGAIPYVTYLQYPLYIYGLVLDVMAVKAVNQFGWGKAIVSVVLIPIFVACVVTSILLLLGPIIGNIFSNIVEMSVTPIP